MTTYVYTCDPSVQGETVNALTQREYGTCAAGTGDWYATEELQTMDSLIGLLIVLSIFAAICVGYSHGRSR